jgi:hypothetical protein
MQAGLTAHERRDHPIDLGDLLESEYAHPGTAVDAQSMGSNSKK